MSKVMKEWARAYKKGDSKRCRKFEKAFDVANLIQKERPHTGKRQFRTLSYDNLTREELSTARELIPKRVHEKTILRKYGKDKQD